MDNNSQKSIADNMLLVDLVENILRFSDNPGSCAGYLTTQIRELIGVRIVAVIEFVTDESGTSHKLIGICPSRKEPYWNQPEIQDFVSRVSNYEKSCLIDPATDVDGKSLSSLGIGKSFVIPLCVGSERVGMIILLDLMETKGASVILETVDKISGVFALILKNSLLYRNLENTVEIRTRQLAQREKEFRALFEQAAVGVAQVDTSSGWFLKINKKYCDIVGYSEEELRNTDLQSITYPDDSKTELDTMELLKSGKIHEFSMEKRYIRRNGDIICVNLTISPMWNPGDPPDYHIIVVQDITQRKQAEDELKKHREHLEELVKERTAQLNTKNEELERFNRLFVGRELRMIELKKKIAELEKKIESPENTKRT
jgi:PAS domain S-box-containing protein